MSDVFHPVTKYDYATLIRELDKRVAAGYLNRVGGPDGLVLYNYTNSCTYDRAWDEFTLMARGLILDTVNHRVAATPFPKFFNFGENASSAPDLPFEAYEKMDGSLIIIFYHDRQWRTATRGSFKSDQAVWAKQQIDDHPFIKDALVKGHTYLAEAVYSANRIVVRYDYEGLVLLGGYHKNGRELDATDLDWPYEWRRASSYKFDSFSDIIARAPTLTRNEEGFVVRFSNGLRLKIKGDEYKRIHRMVSNLSPLSVWEAMLNHDDMIAIRRELPEEFWTDFDRIYSTLVEQKAALADQIAKAEFATREMTNKQIGLDTSIPSDIKGYVFNIRNGRGEKNHERVMDSIRPTGNVLKGYSVSSSLKEAQSDN